MLFTVTNIIMIVLGCHIYDIQKSRIQTAIDFSNNLNSYNQTWFLTGGVKHAIASSINEANTVGHMSEANVMKASINFDTNIVLDTNARNTAENFLNFKKWYQLADFKEDSKIIITTSSFHKDRAEKIFKGIFYDIDIDPVWNLSNLACPTCWSDELIHIKNVESDVNKALGLI